MLYLHYCSSTGKAADAASVMPVETPYIRITEEEWAAALASGKDVFVVDGQIELREPVRTIADYDKAVEDHLLAERVAHGYTKREPSDYAGSAVTRWAQDADDWIAHRDAVMLYALDVINHYEQTGEAPTLDEFKAALPVIQWTNND